MSLFPYQDPPTQRTLQDARNHLTEQRSQMRSLTAEIEAKEEELDRIVRSSRLTIEDLQRERAVIEEQVMHTLAYLAPIRRLPQELLAHVFTTIFDEYPCCAWVLSAVCSVWRRQVLGMPALWSKIRLVTTPESSPDTVRLWLERSGPSVPLDIEIFLHSAQQPATEPQIRRRPSSSTTLSSTSTWEGSWADWSDDWGTGSTVAAEHAGHGGVAYITHVPTGGGVHTIPIMASPITPVMHPAMYAHGHDYHGLLHSKPSWRHGLHAPRSRGSMHWGHIAFFYLAEQMHRWKRFVFRFDRQFSSMSALKCISGDASLLEEFEVSCGEPSSSSELSWLPCAPPTNSFNLGRLTAVTLQYVPFKWSSPIFQNLTSLCLRTNHHNTIALDRVLHILSRNLSLENLALHIQSAGPQVLPLNPTTLEHVRIFSIGGHFLLGTLVECLTLPSVEILVVDIEARDPVEDAVSALLARSNNPPITRLSISYGLHGSGSPIYYHGGASVASWNFLASLDDLRSLQVGGAPFEPLLTILGTPEDDGQDQWYCPQLVSLSLKACRPSHSDGVTKLVQMVEARNPDPASGTVPVAAGGVTPQKLRHLELHDCTPLGLDVIQWLRGRIPEVVCSELSFESRSARSPTFPYM